MNLCIDEPGLLRWRQRFVCMDNKISQEPTNKGPSELLAKVPGLCLQSACVVVLNRILYGSLEGGLVLWVPVPEWF